MIGSLSRRNDQAQGVAPKWAVGAGARSHNLVLSIVTILYLLAMLALFAWLLFDTWIGAHSIPVWLGYDRLALETSTFRLVAYTVIGGALGALVNGIRSFLIHYHRFAARYVWKYLTAPWMGGTLALLVYALIHSSIAVFGGDGSTTMGSTQSLANLAAGALAGYGAKDVFIWLDAQVEKLFQVKQITPDVRDQPKDVAAADIHRNDQAVGNVAPVAQRNGVEPGTVVGQTPAPGEPIRRGDEVSITVAGGSSNGTGQ